MLGLRLLDFIPLELRQCCKGLWQVLVSKKQIVGAIVYQS